MRPNSGWVRMIGLFSIAGFCEVCAYGQITAFTPLHLPELGIATNDVAFWVGAITAVSSVAGLPFLPFWGALADRYGRKPLIVRSYVSAFVALTLAAVAPNILLFAFARAFTSLGLGNTGLMLATLAENAPARQTGLAFGVVNGANPLGAFVGPLVGGPIVDRLGFGPLMALDAVVMAGVIGLLSFGYRRVHAAAGHRVAPGDGSGRRGPHRPIASSSDALPGICGLFLGLAARVHLRPARGGACV